MKLLLQKRLVIESSMLRKTSRMFVLNYEHESLGIKVRI